MSISFLPPSTSIDPSFWEELYRKKRDEFKLETEQQQIWAHLNLSDGSLSLSAKSFDSKLRSDAIRFTGTLLNLNTLTDFKNIDKKNLLELQAKEIYNGMISKEKFPLPSLIFKFVLLVFADLKSYHFTYWSASPAIIPNSPFSLTQSPVLLRNSMFKDHLLDLYHALYTLPHPYHIFVLQYNPDPTTTHYSTALRESHWNIIDFSKIFENSLTENSFIGIIEVIPPVVSPSTTCFTWHMRNLMAFLALNKSRLCKKDSNTVNVIAMRGNLLQKLHQQRFHAQPLTALDGLTSHDLESLDESVMLELDLSVEHFSITEQEEERDVLELPKVVGWETNERGRPGPRMADLSAMLDSSRLFAQASRLNLSLMKWRQWPDLDLEKITGTKCLLLGAGTLGCAVARTLVGWGVRNITFVDNGHVAYSNPTRQCLFEFADSKARTHKATAAAKGLARICPDLTCRDIIMTIPMPGHPLSPNDAPSGTIMELDSLIKEHDVCFVLTDSREARWLPTVVCAAYDKVMINSALGFDSYLVMRHGHGNSLESPTSYPRLGCYFCSDVVAASNSLKDRTLDQQCTVTRPGLSFIASALAVELMVAVLQSPLGNKHPAETKDGFSGNTGEMLDVIPHQIRGSLLGFTQYQPMTNAFQFCSACSTPVTSNYLADPVGFVTAACADENSGKFIEDLCGITALKERTDAVGIEDLIIDDDDF